MTMNLPNDISDIETPESLRPRIARKLGLPLHWDVAIDDLPRPNLLSAAGWGALMCRLYRTIRPQRIGDRCAFEPSCSRYAEISFRAFGFRKGSVLTVRRLKRCNAHNGGLDLPPQICGCAENIERKLYEIQN